MLSKKLSLHFIFSIILSHFLLKMDYLFFGCRQSLIDENIERAVTRMQSIIELGRIVRDRKTIPIKVIIL